MWLEVTSGDELSEVSGRHVTSGRTGLGKEFRFYAEYDETPQKGFKQRCNRTIFKCIKSGLEGRQRGTGEISGRLLQWSG